MLTTNMANNTGVLGSIFTLRRSWPSQAVVAPQSAAEYAEVLQRLWHLELIKPALQSKPAMWTSGDS